MTFIVLLPEGNDRFKMARVIESAMIREGSGFIFIPEEEVFIAIDHAVNNKNTMAFDLTGGKLLQGSDQLSLLFGKDVLF